ncbi:OsmC family protein [Yangia mangrovi]|uniref:OsmC family protein n=1 Tax=Alloyangia mangrovi TaxID=1779329 RepID=A0A2A3JS07_9RHOB|nr:OsmC family protein [Alloyangia mangrovi]MCT4369143.1 OsmC family protein [Alloyangia mangrovi]
MALKLRPKRFGPVSVLFNPEGPVRFVSGEGGEPLPHPPYDKPVLTLMASVAHCLVESLRIVAKRDEVALPAYAITVTAEKAIDEPGRLQSMVCRIEGYLPEEMLREAKSMCTVSNTLNCKITLE